MTNNLSWSQHALDQMASRNISRQEARFVLSNPVRRPNIIKNGTQRWEKRDFVRGHEVKVVYVENPTWTIIVTVMWVYEKEDDA